MATTTNYGWSKPDVGGSSNVWGAILNTFLDALDTTLKAVSDVANAALAKAGGVMTGRLDLKNYTEARQDLGAVNGNPVNLDLSVSQHKTATITGATTFAITGLPAGTVAVGLVLRLTNGGSFAVSWPASFKFPGGSAPALTAVGRDLIVAVTEDGGVTWQASALLGV
jgi:hypothetical protein